MVFLASGRWKLLAFEILIWISWFSTCKAKSCTRGDTSSTNGKQRERERERDEDQAFRTLLIDDLLSHHAMHGKNDSEVHKEQNDPVESVPFFQLSHLSTPRTLGNELGNITQSIDASQPFG